jgi:hypothetical protein
MTEQKKPTADEIRAELGYRVVPKRRDVVAQPRPVNQEARTVKNGRAIADFDNFMSSARIVVKHKRSVARILEEAVKRVR